MATPRSRTAKTRSQSSKPRKIAIYAKVSQDVVEKLDKIAEDSGINRSALVSILCTQYAKSAITPELFPVKQ
jgi:hypothetical protein